MDTQQITLGLATCNLFLHYISKVILSVTSLIDVSFCIASTNVIFGLLDLYLFLIPQLGSTHSFLPVH